MSDLYADLKSAGCELDNHESDLYVKDTWRAREIIARHGKKIDGHNVSVFRSQIDNRQWLDIPFAYTPWWQARQRA